MLKGAPMTRIRIRQLTGLDTLAGKSGGLRDFPKFLAAIEQMPSGDTVVLDWSGIEIVTASYLGATYGTLLRMAMAGDLDRYFVVTGLNKNGLDELKLVIDVQKLIALVGDSEEDGSLHNVHFLGSLDPAYAETLQAVQKIKTASALDLYKRAQTRTRIGKTAWINRLSNLHRLRLVRKLRVGRQYMFESVN
jgi:hypothetical protein